MIHPIPEGSELGRRLGTVYCEIKPVLGDDYPCLLRKMNTQIQLTNNYITKHNDELKQSYEKDWRRGYCSSKEGSIYDLMQEQIKPNYILLVKDFSSSTTTKEQLIQIFQQSNIKVIFLKDIMKIDNQQIQAYSSDNITELKDRIKQLEEENIILKERLKQYETSI